MSTRRYRTPDGIRPDVVLCLPEGSDGAGLAHAAAIAGLGLVQVADLATGWEQAQRWGCFAVVAGATDILRWQRESGCQLSPNVAMVAIVQVRDSAALAVALQRIGVAAFLNGAETVSSQIAVLTNLRRGGSADWRQALSDCCTLPGRVVWESALMEEAMQRTQGNLAAAARLLGISRQALHQRLRERGSPPGFLPTAAAEEEVCSLDPLTIDE